MGSFDKRAFSRRLVERFSAEVADRLGTAIPGAERSRLAAIATRALSATIDALDAPAAVHARSLPVTWLRAAEVIAGGSTARRKRRCTPPPTAAAATCVTPGARTIGKRFPAWQFVEPVPELIAPVLSCLARQPGSEVHAFWVTGADELNERRWPTAGRPPLRHPRRPHASQQALWRLPSDAREQRVIEFAQQQASGKADVIG